MKDYRFIYFATVDSTGEEFNFITSALLDIGTPVLNDAGLAAHVTDMAVDYPISCAELKVDIDIARAFSM